MQIGFNLCNMQGHEGCKLTHICISTDCKRITRFLFDKCINNSNLIHDGYSYVESENFTKRFQNLRLQQLEFRLKSLNGNNAKLNYLKKIFQNDLDDFGWIEKNLQEQKHTIERIKDIIKDLISDYLKEIEQVQLLGKIYKYLLKDGLFSLNDEQLNTLLDDQFKFINQEIEYYNQLNIQLNQLDEDCLEEEEQSENYQKLGQLLKKLRRINDYLDIQQYSIVGKEFILEGYDRIYLQKQDRYFAIYDFYFEPNNQNDCNPLQIRKQNTFDVSHSLSIKSFFGSINFDPLFNYCIVQSVQSEEKLDAHLYTLRNARQFKLIKNFRLYEKVREFYVSNNNIILILQDTIFVKVINLKNELINEIKLECLEELCLKYSERQYILSKILFCYGSEKNIIVIEDQQVKLYLETQQQPLCCFNIDQRLQSMKFINDDSELVTLDQFYCKSRYIDYCNFTITQINKIQSYSYFVDINGLNFTKLNQNGCIQILDRNHNLWYSFKPPRDIGNPSIKLTKHLIAVNWYSGCQFIKRRSIADYEKLEYDY